jgi:hypothetical protein
MKDADTRAIIEETLRLYGSLETRDVDEVASDCVADRTRLARSCG